MTSGMTGTGGLRPHQLPATTLFRSVGGLRRLGGPGVSMAEEVDMVEVGDRVLVESEKVGSAARSGVVTDVDGRLITVHWDSGSSSTFVPSAGCLEVRGHEPHAEAVNNS